MNRMRRLGAGAIAATFLLVLSIAAFGQATLTLEFREMGPHVGQLFELRVVEIDTGREIARYAISEIEGASFDFEVPDLVIGASYRIDFYADANGNGLYDAPPADHAWRVEFPDVQGDATLTFIHNVDFSDIEWPPQIDGTIGESEYRNSMTDSATGMSVSWQNDGSILYVGLVAPGTGWLSIGFEPERQMQGADIIIGAVSGDQLVIEDHYGNAPTSHRKDTVDHIIQAAGSESNGETILEFAIPLDSGDSQDKTLVAGSRITIILAYHASNDRLTARHTERSATSITLDG